LRGEADLTASEQLHHSANSPPTIPAAHHRSRSTANTTSAEWEQPDLPVRRYRAADLDESTMAGNGQNFGRRRRAIELRTIYALPPVRQHGLGEPPPRESNTCVMPIDRSHSRFSSVRVVAMTSARRTGEPQRSLSDASRRRVDEDALPTAHPGKMVERIGGCDERDRSGRGLVR
jgi:hypothetical protein